MTSSPRELSAPPVGSAETSRLDRLLCEVPQAAPIAAAQLATAATDAVGGAVTVFIHSTTGWSALAGPAGPAVPSTSELQHRDRTDTGAVQVGRVALVWDPTAPRSGIAPARLRQACAWLAAGLDRDDALDDTVQAAQVADVTREVLSWLLSVRDLDQVLLSIADRTRRLLDADICGVLLAEGDELRMRSCVGNRAIETARLRMRRGQGVAGLVFLTGEPAKVDTYLADTTISLDFMSLAEKEETESALAVPLRLRGEFIGVLEVWRRRRSVFTDDDTRHMVTLADFATIAIDNARLHDQQAAAVEQMKQARDALEDQVGVLKASSNLQQTLLTTVLEGAGLHAISRTVATEFGCRIAIYGPDGALVSAHDGARSDTTFPHTMQSRVRAGRKQLRLTDKSQVSAWMQPIYADGDQIGSVAIVPGSQSAEMMDIVTGQVAMACSLTLLRERAASRARAEELEQVLWDLLQGSVEHRVAARTRAAHLNVALRGELRVLYGRIENLERLAADNGWDTSRTDRLRRDILRAVHGFGGESPRLALSAMRGDVVMSVAANLDRAAAKHVVTDLSDTIRTKQPELKLTWGISRAHTDVVDLPGALDEAKTALSAAHRLGGESAFLYEELGIVRLLLGSGNDPDLQTFINEVTGPLVRYDEEHNGALVRTLRAFFDADCSRRVAAERLFIHYKTLLYRLEQIQQLTGLDMNRHDDRMRADFALRLLQVNQPLDGTDQPS